MKKTILFIVFILLVEIAGCGWLYEPVKSVDSPSQVYSILASNKYITTEQYWNAMDNSASESKLPSISAKALARLLPNANIADYDFASEMIERSYNWAGFGYTMAESNYLMGDMHNSQVQAIVGYMAFTTQQGYQINLRTPGRLTNPQTPSEWMEMNGTTVARLNGGQTAVSAGAGSSVTSNKGNTYDTTPSSNHSTTTSTSIKGAPNSSVDILDKNGNVVTRRWFDSDGNQIRDVDFTNHGNPKTHPEWPHEHGTRP